MSHECFRESLTHLWVDFFGVRIPTQVNVKTSTIGDLIEVALEKKGLRKSLKSYDAYVTYCGYIVKEDQLLSSLLIYKDSTFLVHQRVRGGMVLELIDCQPFVDYVNFADRFHSVSLPKRLRPPKTGFIKVVFLSQHGRCSLHAILVCLAAIHRHGQSLDGNFDIQDIMFSGTIAVIRSSVTRVTFDEENVKKDYAKLADIIEIWFAMNGQHPVLYVDHLLRLLRDLPSDEIYSECFRCYINNHCCVMSFLERLKLYQALDTYYRFLKQRDKNTFARAVGMFDGWSSSIQSIEPFYNCYMYHPIGDEPEEECSRYSNKAIHWLQFCRNFISHAMNQRANLGCFYLEQAEAALAWHFLNNLPELLLNIITNYKPSDGFDIRILFGNEKSDLAARS